MPFSQTTRTLSALAVCLVSILSACGQQERRVKIEAPPPAPHVAPELPGGISLTGADLAILDRLDRAEDLRVWLLTAAWNLSVYRATHPEAVIPLTRDWDALNRCEQGGEWYADGYNPADPGHQHFVGGLGMSTAAWSIGVRAAARRGVTLPGWANDASILQQKVGAQAFLDETGGGWACPI